ncbi:MAG: ferrochelatase [Wigglesworthia glossinidia]|nr:ferrochelatase [Wigglesworthia glossinidia]
MKIESGLILVNLGTPKAPNKKSVKKYLSDFLSDKRVIDISKIFWKIYLHVYLLPIRSTKVANLYKKIWRSEGSPLMINSVLQKKALVNSLPNIHLELAMRYGEPTLKNAIKKMLLEYNVKKLIILPLYPQYSCSTTASVFDEVANILKKYRSIPSVIFIRDYADNTKYIHALKRSIKNSFNMNGYPERLILSFHGIPKKYIEDGDDYLERCKTTKKLLISVLDYPKNQIIMSFQSQFGKIPWIHPITSNIISDLPKKNVKNIQIICPGFSSDCLETLEEIQIRNELIFKNSGGNSFHYIPALNDQDCHIECLASIVKEYLN